MSKIDLDYAYGPANLSNEASKHYVFSIIDGNFNRPLPFQEKFLRAVGYSNRLSRSHQQSTGI